MRVELEEELFKKYPKLFKQKDDSMHTTAMCWGFECGDGWYSIIDGVCKLIKDISKPQNWQIEFTQVKEKFAGLRMYYDWVGDSSDLRDTEMENKIEGAIMMAERMSTRTCEQCGATSDVEVRGDSWLKTLCSECYEEYPY